MKSSSIASLKVFPNLCSLEAQILTLMTSRIMQFLSSPYKCWTMKFPFLCFEGWSWEISHFFLTPFFIIISLFLWTSVLDPRKRSLGQIGLHSLSLSPCQLWEIASQHTISYSLFSIFLFISETNIFSCCYDFHTMTTCFWKGNWAPVVCLITYDKGHTIEPIVGLISLISYILELKVVYLLSYLMNPNTTTAAKRYNLSYHFGKVTILENAPWLYHNQMD